MADLDDTPAWPEIYRLDRNDPVRGYDPAFAAEPIWGADGPDNMSPRQLAQRTRYLRERLERTLVVPVAFGTTVDLTTAAVHKRTLRVVATVDSPGATYTTLDVPAGELVVINECRWPIRVRGPSGNYATVPARVPPDAQSAHVFADEVDTSLLGKQVSVLRPVAITAVTPASMPAAGVTAVTVTGKGFLGAIDVQVAINSIAFTVVSDTEIQISVDGPAIGAVAGPSQVQVLRSGGENDIFGITFT